MDIKRRYCLNKKEIKKLKEEINNMFKADIIPNKGNIEIAITENYEMILLNNEPLAFRINNNSYPTLKTILKHDLNKNKVIVDMGALRFIANGADVMAPGIIDADKEIKKDDIVFVADETHNKPLCIGIALMDGIEMKESNKGKAIKTIHYIGDEVWNFK